MATEEEIRAALVAAGIDPDGAPTPSRPQPDPSQGRGSSIKAPDFRSASTEDLHAEYARLGFHPRHK